MATSVTGDLELALLQFQRGQLREVIVSLRPVLIDLRMKRQDKNGRDPGFAEVRAGLFLLYGRVHHLMEDYEEASEALESAREYSGIDKKLLDEIALESAYLNYDQDKNDEHWRALNDVLAGIKSKQSELSLEVLAHCYLGQACLSRGDLFRAAKELHTACGISRGLAASQVYASHLPLTLLALLHLNEGRLPLAAAMARDALNTVEPGAASRIAQGEVLANSAYNVLPLIVLTRALSQQGLPSRAILAAGEAYDQALESFGDEHSMFRQALAARARAQLQSHEYSGAAQDYEQLLQIIEQRAKAHKMDNNVQTLLGYILRTELALCLARSGESARAQKYLEHNLKMMTTSGMDSVDLDKVTNVDTVERDILKRSAASCYLEQQLIEELSVAYLRQGKVGDMVRLVPASMRADYNCRLERAVSLLNLVIKKGQDLLEPKL